MNEVNLATQFCFKSLTFFRLQTNSKIGIKKTRTAIILMGKIFHIFNITIKTIVEWNAD